MKQPLYILIVIFFTSCTSNTIYKKPKNLIPKDSMILLLTDMYIASSAKFSKNKYFESDVDYMALVYQKYKIDSVRFKSSNTYYTSKIEQYYKMLDSVKKRLEFQRNIIEKEIKKKDSLENIKGKEKHNSIKELDSLNIGKFE